MNTVSGTVSDVNSEVAAHTVESGPKLGIVKVGRGKKPATLSVEQCRTKARQIVATAFAASGMTRHAAADAAGVSRTMVDRWLGDFPRSMPLGRILVMGTTSTRGRDAARLILASALTYLDGPEPYDSDRSIRDMVDDFHAEVGEVAAVWRSATEDRQITPDEAKGIIRALHDVERCCSKLRHSAEKIANGQPVNV